MKYKNNLRGLWIGVVLGTLLTAALIVIPARAGGEGGEEGGRAGHDIVLMRCSVTGQQFSVSAYQGSVATPARKSESCAETLAKLNKAGFAIAHVGYSHDADSVLYTVSR